MASAPDSSASETSSMAVGVNDARAALKSTFQGTNL